MIKTVDCPNYQIRVNKLKNQVSRYDLYYNDIIKQANKMHFKMTKNKLSLFFNFKMRARTKTYNEIEKSIKKAINAKK